MHNVDLTEPPPGTQTTTSPTTSGTGSIFRILAISIVSVAKKSMTVMLSTKDASNPARRGNTTSILFLKTYTALTCDTGEMLNLRVEKVLRRHH